MDTACFKGSPEDCPGARFRATTRACSEEARKMVPPIAGGHEHVGGGRSIHIFAGAWQASRGSGRQHVRWSVNATLPTVAYLGGACLHPLIFYIHAASRIPPGHGGRVARRVDARWWLEHGCLEHAIEFRYQKCDQ